MRLFELIFKHCGNTAFSHLLIDMLIKSLFKGMTAVEEIRIVSNKIDRIEDYALPSQNTVRRLILEGNHILEVPSLSALEDIQVEKVVKIFKLHYLL